MAVEFRLRYNEWRRSLLAARSQTAVGGLAINAACSYLEVSASC